MQVCDFEIYFSFILESILNIGELSSRLVNDLENIREGTGFRVADFICLLSRIIGTLIFSFYTGWKLTLVFLSISPLIVLTFNILIRVSERRILINF
jgi:ATP-binding cassette subfamily B (MDR/TAP) protein 1